jgi:hypothetical protein
MKVIIFDIVQMILTIIVLTFYLLTHSSNESVCDINANIVYSLKAYILFSINTFFCISLFELILYYYLKNQIILNIVVITISYCLIIFILLGGIFIAEKMNEKSECYNFFIDHNSVFCIFISIILLAIINIIYKCFICKQKQQSHNYEYYEI